MSLATPLTTPLTTDLLTTCYTPYLPAVEESLARVDRLEARPSEVADLDAPRVRVRARVRVRVSVRVRVRGRVRVRVRVKVKVRVTDLDAPALVDQQVLRLEVAVEHGRIERVEVVHAARDVAADAGCRLAPDS